MNSKPYDLRLVPWDDIEAEMKSRFRTYIVAWTALAEGQTVSVWFGQASKTGTAFEGLGLAESACDILRRQIQSSLGPRANEAGDPPTHGILPPRMP
jgi:hypothetical protein